ncbi:RICIN domain-containing protein [Streptomyces sp. NPDC052396]|uniref:RICIN domain-containing protein n=1 Tax=Streptomyces sp. NPDC052396 TaxID=3365689 RepID=UPI0037D78EEA
MSRGRRAAQRPRKRRGIVAAAVAVTAGAVIGGAAWGGVFGGEGSGHSRVTAQAVATAPAALPEHDEAPEPVTRIPGNDRAHGMVYTGLRLAPKGDHCAGVLETEGGRCTHGPDKPPRGVDIKKDTPPAVKAKATAADPSRPETEKPATDQPSTGTVAALDAKQAGKRGKTPPAPASPKGGTGKAAPSEQTVPCDGDGSTGNRVQVLYVHGPGNDRYAEYLASFHKWAADVDTIYYASAQETGGVRHVRFVTGADCTPSVLNVELPDSALAEFSATNSALAAKGFDRRDRKYMIFADANVYCGIGTFNGDERPGQDNQSNFGPSYGRTDNGCWSGSTAAHELGHNLGAVNNSAPHSSKAAHCTDEWDIMCYSDAPYYPQMQIVCPDRAHDDRLDCNHDDYYNTNPQQGSYLDTHWNVANNQFLMTGNGTNPNPTPNPTPTPTPTPSPTPTKGTDGAPVPVLGELTSDSAVLSWPAVPSADWYRLVLNGNHLGWVQSNSVRVYNLQPDTDYTLAVAVRDRSGHDTDPGKAVSFHTPAAGAATRPGTRYLLTNGEAGVAAQIYGDKTADGTVAVGSQPNGYAGQQWVFDDTGNGYVHIRSVVTNKCLQLGGDAVEGQWIAQQPCSGSLASQWHLAKSGTGVQVTARGSSLVLGVSDRPYYGALLLELQKPDGPGHHTWTVQKTG